MADQPSSPEREDRADRGPAAGPPRWVKVSGIIALALVLLVCSSCCSPAATMARAATSHPADTAASCRP